MSSIAKPTTRSKKTTRLGPVQVIRPDQYEAFGVDSQLECIRALIPLGLMHVQEVLEEEVYQEKIQRKGSFRERGQVCCCVICCSRCSNVFLKVFSPACFARIWAQAQLTPP